MSPDHGVPGNGLLLFFRVDDFDLAIRRARSLVSRFEEEPHLNSNTRTKEFSLRDPDGYWQPSSVPSPCLARFGVLCHPNTSAKSVTSLIPVL